MYGRFLLVKQELFITQLTILYYTPTGTTCPTNFDVVGDECLYESSNAVSTSEACLTECGDDMGAEIHTAAQRDAVIAYAGGTLTVDSAFYIGKQAHLL